MSDRTPRAPTGAGHVLSNDRAARLCLYPGRTCYQLRDLKRNGELHRFCRMHRQRHNQYQRESQARRRRRRQMRRRHAQMPLPLGQVEWSDALGLVDATDVIVTDAELFSVLHELFGEPDTATNPLALYYYQQIEIDPLPDGLEDP